MHIAADDVLDKERLDMIMGEVSSEQLVPLLKAVFSDIRDREKSLTHAVETQNQKDIRLHAHSLKSETATFGMAALSDLSKTIEEMHQSNDVDHIQKLLETYPELTSRSFGAVIDHLGQKNDTITINLFSDFV